MTEAESLQWDANTVMEQIQMAESRHMQMGALCSYLLQYPDMTNYVNSQSPVDFFDEAYSYFDDYFDELVEEVKGGQSENDLN